jgi:hypothetical protein
MLHMLKMHVHVCCEHLFQMFRLFLDVCCKGVYLNVAYILHICCRCFIWMLQMFWNGFSIVFHVFLQVFHLSLDICCKCFIWMFQKSIKCCCWGSTCCSCWGAAERAQTSWRGSKGDTCGPRVGSGYSGDVRATLALHGLTKQSESAGVRLGASNAILVEVEPVLVSAREGPWLWVYKPCSFCWVVQRGPHIRRQLWGLRSASYPC